MPDVRLTTSALAVSLTLAMPDVRYIELDAAAGIAFNIARSGTFAGEMELMLMRVR